MGCAMMDRGVGGRVEVSVCEILPAHVKRIPRQKAIKEKAPDLHEKVKAGAPWERNQALPRTPMRSCPLCSGCQLGQGPYRA